MCHILISYEKRFSDNNDNNEQWIKRRVIFYLHESGSNQFQTSRKEVGWARDERINTTPQVELVFEKAADAG